MPGVPKNNQQIAIQQEAAAENALPQPRQPSNLQGLLRYAVEAQGAAAPNAPVNQVQPLNDESKQFLEEALKSMTVDVIALMKAQIAILQNVDNIPEDEINEKYAAFETILDYISNIDIANDFHKINGFSIFEPCLKCQNAEIRAYACDTIAELSQNNPYIQQVICDCTNLISTLLKLLESEQENKVIVKILYAISCISRDSDLGYQNFKRHNGLAILKKVLEKDDEKIRTKITFLLSALCGLDKELINILISMNFLPQLINLVKEDWKSSHEHVLSLIQLIVENNSECRTNLKQSAFNLREIIDKHLSFVRGKDEYKEEQTYCENILKMVFP